MNTSRKIKTTGFYLILILGLCLCWYITYTLHAVDGMLLSTVEDSERFRNKSTQLFRDIEMMSKMSLSGFVNNGMKLLNDDEFDVDEAFSSEQEKVVRDVYIFEDGGLRCIMGPDGSNKYVSKFIGKYARMYEEYASKRFRSFYYESDILFARDTLSLDKPIIMLLRDDKDGELRCLVLSLDYEECMKMAVNAVRTWSPTFISLNFMNKDEITGFKISEKGAEEPLYTYGYPDSILTVSMADEEFKVAEDTLYFLDYKTDLQTIYGYKLLERDGWYVMNKRMADELVKKKILRSDIIAGVVFTIYIIIVFIAFKARSKSGEKET